MPQAPDKNHFYGDAVVYDILHASGTAAEARAIEAIAAELTGHPGPYTILEPACGTARHLRWLARSNHHGIGFDLADHMIADARHRAERAGIADRLTLFTADMTDFAARMPRKADIAFNLINTIRHLPDDASMLAHFEQVHAALKRRAAYVIGLSTTIYGIEQPSEDIWTGARGPCRVIQTANYLPPDPPARTETVISHILVETPGGDDHRDCTFTLRTYSLEELLNLFDRSCMRLDRVLDDEGVPMAPPTLGYALFVLRPR